ncbi:dihydrofolate synthase [Malassezia brasiliensis]|uniref:Dihydrofolate synthase n=1 Tax=Malassezia brasiliensis TaxID=1821822 RepID=A0AAF0DQZ0_9BASI|nr:dihydrofolate synthase [Malassezia brasiliensis]
MDLGLGRVQALLRRVGSPHTRFPVIHVAGTNGKGSTTAYLDSLLTHGVGLRSARFNSPHLMLPRDCARVHGGVPIDAQTWALAEQQIRSADVSGGAPGSDTPIDATPFELLTVQTLLAFTLLPPDARPEVLVIEVGVGGRLDATNVFPSENVLASVICPIDLDHEKLLGEGLAAIAHEKAGIVKPRGLCVVADQRRSYLAHGGELHAAPVERSILESLQQTCRRQNARVVPTTIPYDALRLGAPPGVADIARLRAPVAFSLSLHGVGAAADPWDAPVEGAVNVQVEATPARLTGSTTALQTLWSIAHDRSEVGHADAAARQAIRDAIRTRLFGADAACAARVQDALVRYVWEGRSEWKTLGAHTPLLLDGAHNVASAAALRLYLEACLDTYTSTAAAASSSPVDVHLTWIMAFSEGKDQRGMLDALLRDWRASGAWRCMAQRVAFVPFSTPVEGMPWVHTAAPDALRATLAAAHVPGVGATQVTTWATLREALAWAVATPQPALEVVVVCGSLYLVSDYYRDSCEA